MGMSKNICRVPGWHDILTWPRRSCAVTCSRIFWGSPLSKAFPPRWHFARDKPIYFPPLHREGARKSERVVTDQWGSLPFLAHDPEIVWSWQNADSWTLSFACLTSPKGKGARPSQLVCRRTRDHSFRSEITLPKVLFLILGAEQLEDRHTDSSRITNSRNLCAISFSRAQEIYG